MSDLGEERVKLLDCGLDVSQCFKSVLFDIVAKYHHVQKEKIAIDVTFAALSNCSAPSPACC